MKSTGFSFWQRMVHVDNALKLLRQWHHVLVFLFWNMCVLLQFSMIVNTSKKKFCRRDMQTAVYETKCAMVSFDLSCRQTTHGPLLTARTWRHARAAKLSICDCDDILST